MRREEKVKRKEGGESEVEQKTSLKKKEERCALYTAVQCSAVHPV
jgi:hypothetical protein